MVVTMQAEKITGSFVSTKAEKNQRQLCSELLRTRRIIICVLRQRLRKSETTLCLVTRTRRIITWLLRHRLRKSEAALFWVTKNKEDHHMFVKEEAKKIIIFD